jgi:hypothetical protein
MKMDILEEEMKMEEKDEDLRLEISLKFNF